MATQANYHFDHWAEYLAVTLAANITDCDLAHQPIEKLRLNIHPQTYWPLNYKVMLKNHLVASNHNINHQNGSSPVLFPYKNPSFIPADPKTRDPVALGFLKSVNKWQTDFYDTAWNLNQHDSIPGLVRQMALRSLSKVVTAQLKHQGFELDAHFEVQFFDGQNYKTFYYDHLVNELERCIALYLTHEKSRQLAANVCFKHKKNRDWFLSL